MIILRDPAFKTDAGGGVLNQIGIPSSDNQEGGAKGEAPTELEEEETPAKETEEQTEGEKKDGVKFSDFFDAAGAASERDNAEEEATQAQAKKKPVEKKEDEETEVEQVQQTKVDPKGKTQQQQQKATDTRDYSGIPEADVPLFKKMSNDSFNKFKPIYQEHAQQKATIAERDLKIAELQKGVPILPDYYFEHPQGYLLDPTYAQAEANEGMAKQLVQHWSLQLARIRRGEQWNDLVTDAKGNISMDKPQAATAEAESAVNGYLVDCQQQLLEQRANLKSVTENFSKKHKEDITLLREGESKYFPGFEKADHPTANIQKEFLKMLPASFRSSPLASILAKTAAINVMMRTELEELKKVQGAKSAGGNQQQNGKGKQPTKSQAGSRSSGSEAKDGVKFSDFTSMLS